MAKPRQLRHLVLCSIGNFGNVIAGLENHSQLANTCSNSPTKIFLVSPECVQSYNQDTRIRQCYISRPPENVRKRLVF